MKRALAFSAVSTVFTVTFLFIVNLITSWEYPWFIYPSFVMLWWPLVLSTAARSRYKLFSIIGGVYSAAFFVIVNLVTNPQTVWFIYPVFAVLWWPMCHIICGAKKYKLLSIAASLYIIAFLVVVNLITSPGYLWFIYPSYAVTWWPMSMYLLRKPNVADSGSVDSACSAL